MWDGFGSFQSEPAPLAPWVQWFAWYPVTVKGKRKWLTRVWRRQKESCTNKKSYEYGTLFDVMRDS